MSQKLGWTRKGSQEEDEMIVEANKYLLDAASDGDLSNRISFANGKPLRDSMTIEEAEDMEREMALRGFKRRN